MSNSKFVFDRINYILTLVCIGLILFGFIIMSLEQAEYGFGFLGLTLGPIVIMLGFLTGLAAILYKKK
jgi:hypothetical protein